MGGGSDLCRCRGGLGEGGGGCRHITFEDSGIFWKGTFARPSFRFVFGADVRFHLAARVEMLSCEVLDDHWGAWNWQKVIGLGELARGAGYVYRET